MQFKISYNLNMRNEILGVAITPHTKQEILSIISSRLDQKKMTTIVSLNPEILVAAQSQPKLKRILNAADIKLIDGVGIVMAGKLLSVPVGERYTGVDLMSDLLRTASEKDHSILVIGGKKDVAQTLAKQMTQQFPGLPIQGTEGIEDVKKPTLVEEKNMQDLIQTTQPNIVFVAFGAPYQEYWIDDHQELLEGKVAVCVGGGVDFLAKKVPRAPEFIQKIGLEWLFRLGIEPWRWRRQLRLVQFIFLVLKQKFSPRIVE
jgi:N-acetylglucosaminyldiphosphoundecaprenol N-acetyl-beta-D-mannosaminyltransferase